MTIITLGTGTSAPSSINELTKLVLWNALKIREIQPKEERILYENFSPQRIISYQIFDTPDYGIRCALQVIIKLQGAWLSTSGKAWEKAEPITINADSPENASNTFTPGTGGSIPQTVNTHAKLAVWCADAAQRIVPTTQVVEDPAVGAISLASISTGKAFDGLDTALIRYSIPLTKNHLSQSSPIWDQALAFNGVALPDDLLT